MRDQAASRDEHVHEELGVEEPGIGVQPNQEPINSDRTSHSRALSESQNLLPNSPRNLFEYRSAQAIRWAGPEVLREHGELRRDENDWDGAPQTLRKRRREIWRDAVVDFVMLGIALPFFALAGAVIYFDQKDIQRVQQNVLDQCTKGVSKSLWFIISANFLQAATLFPLTFSLIVGRAAYKAASWKLERGSSIGLLEQLLGSRTVSGTLITQFRLWPFGFVGLGLLLLWSLSPLGSQAALRILSTGSKPITSTTNITHFNSRQSSYSGSGQFEDSWFTSFATLFSASLLSPAAVKTGPADLWGNVKIPYFSSLANISKDSDGWREIPSTNFAPVYSSLFGIPLSGLPTGSTTFNVESTYLKLTCSNRTTNITRGADRIASFQSPGLISTNGPFNTAQNVTAATKWAIGYLGEDVTPLLSPSTSTDANKCLDCLSTNVTNGTFYPSLFLYEDLSGLENATSIYCTSEQEYVESAILCSNTSSSHSCAVTAQRLSKLPHASSALTLLSFDEVFEGLSRMLPNATQLFGGIDTMQNYIANPTSNAFIQSAKYAFEDGKESRFLDLSLDDFAERLGQVLNTFLQGSMLNATNFLTGDGFDHIQGAATNSSSDSPPSLYDSIKSAPATLTVPANFTTQAEIYKVSYPWLIIFLLCTSILPIATITSVILSRHTLSRDYLGFVSSLARESPHVNNISQRRGHVGVGMHGLERSRKWSDIKVRLGDIGDVDGGWEIGTGVALTVGRMAIGDKGSTKRLDRRKLYL